MLMPIKKIYFDIEYLFLKIYFLIPHCINGSTTVAIPGVKKKERRTDFILISELFFHFLDL